MLSYVGAREVADYLRAKAEVERAPLAGFLVLLLAAALAALAPPARLAWSLGLLAALLVGPPLVKRLLPKRNMSAFRLSLVAYPLNALLLAFVVYLQVAGWDFLPSEDFPLLARILPWSGLIVGGAYGVLQFPHWLRRVTLYGHLARALQHPPPEHHLKEVELFLQETLEGEGASFRSVPTTPKNWSLFLKLDTQVHGLWRVAFAPAFALVVFEDGSGLETVPKGGLKVVADDPKPGEAVALCLIRWNQHLMEGRITPEDCARIQAWNKQA